MDDLTSRFRFRLAVVGWGYTYCNDGVDLDLTIRRQLRTVPLEDITIYVEPKEASND